MRDEYELLKQNQLLDRTLLIFKPRELSGAVNRVALEELISNPALRLCLAEDLDRPRVALRWIDGKPLLLTACEPGPAAYLLALRAHFQRLGLAILASAAQAAPEPPLRPGWLSNLV